MSIRTAVDGQQSGVADTGLALVEARGLYRFFHAGDEETVALREVSLALGAGELVALVGPSGSGKSTLLGCLAGLDDPDAGTVTVAGRRISRVGEAARTRLRARHIGVLLQSSNLIGHLTVAANVALAQSLAGRRGHAARTARADLLDRLGLAGRAGAYPSTLSGGEAARAGLAVAVAGAPPVLLADEPTGELDRGTATDVLGLLGEQATAGTAVLVATHDEAITAAADRVLRMRDGQLQ